MGKLVYWNMVITLICILLLFSCEKTEEIQSNDLSTELVENNTNEQSYNDSNERKSVMPPFYSDFNEGESVMPSYREMGKLYGRIENENNNEDNINDSKENFSIKLRPRTPGLPYDYSKTNPEWIYTPLGMPVLFFHNSPQKTFAGTRFDPKRPL